MEINFIEVVSEALDALSVERLVRTLPMGSVRCKKCKKLLYTEVQARFAILRMVLDEQRHMDYYPCPEQEGSNYHLTDLDKRLNMEINSWWRKELERKKSHLEQLRHIQGLRSNHRTDGYSSALGQENLVVLDGKSSTSIPYTKALRRKIIRALDIPVQGLRKPRKSRYRRELKLPIYTRQRDTARVDLPRGEIMTKMLAWPNGKNVGFNRRLMGYYQAAELKRKRSDQLRRRNRAREAEAMRRFIEAEGLRFVDFNGIYTSGR